jgi:hypothetical protein
MLSTVPQTHTTDMHSWFPLFIPLSQPVREDIDKKETEFVDRVEFRLSVANQVSCLTMSTLLRRFTLNHSFSKLVC